MAGGPGGRLSAPTEVVASRLERVDESQGEHVVHVVADVGVEDEIDGGRHGACPRGLRAGAS